MSKNQNFWQTLASIGKSILAHVNFNYDGATGSIHIDIIPADPQEVIVEEQQKAIEQTADVKALPEQADSPDDQASDEEGKNSVKAADSTSEEKPEEAGQ